ncbi:helix-turn-helix domain-containing protein [Enterococcus faecalis]|uniref:helix-turn-helix domain-containing protein n=1 Tax=Enterococcus faecalis TaxID=1351 RepID=UPI000453595B|nr:helix-turn-helix domain-containing protein [Enterococcus faecalis]ETU12295.1 hypothetical protein P009_02683 [Enterococcus faecalis EnGen0409]
MLTFNEQRLLEQLLKEEEFQTFDALASHLGLSVRTVRNLLNKLEPTFQQNHLRLSKKYGVGIKLISEKQSFREISENIHTSIVVRREVLKLMLLFYYRKKVSINQLSQVFFLTKSSVLADLKIVEKELAVYNLKIVRSHQGTELLGHRTDIKSAIIDSVHLVGTAFIFENRAYLSKNQFYCQKILVSEFKNVILSGIRLISIKYSYSFNEDFIQTLVIQLMVDILLFGKQMNEKQSKDGSDPATDFQLYLEQTLGFTFSNQYNPNRIGEYLAACEYRKPQKSSPLHEIAKQVLTSYQDLQQVRMDTSNLIDKIADNIGQIKQRNHYRMSVFHPLLNDLQLNFGKEFIALRFCFLAIEKRVGYVSDDELCFLLVTILNTPQRYKPQLTARLASNGSSEYRQFIKRELQRNLSDVQVFLNEEVSIADWQFIFSKNKQLKKLADDNIKFDVFNKSHLAIVKNETALYKRFKVERGCSIPSIFETISMSNKLSKAKVVEKITERLIEEEVTDFATIEDAFNRDQHQPLIWRKMECAILFMIDPRQLQSQIREFSWSALINWCENNQNNQVRKVVIIVAGKIEEIDFYEIFRRFVSNG